MKRFLRYLLLVSCTGLIMAWIASYFYWFNCSFTSNQNCYAVVFNYGNLNFYWGTGPFFKANPYFFALGHTSPNPVFNIPTLSDRFSFMGVFVRPKIILYHMWIGVPIWIVLTVIGTPTVTAWHRPLKVWWQGTDRKGFEVQLKPESKAHGQDAHATDKPV